MGGTNPDTLSGATITVERRIGQMEARALGGPSYLSYMRGFVYNVLALRDSPRCLSFDSLGFPPSHTSEPRGVYRAYRDTNPMTGLTGQQPPVAYTSADHTVFILLKQQNSALRDYRKRVSALSRRQKLRDARVDSIIIAHCQIVRGRFFQNWMLEFH